MLRDTKYQWSVFGDTKSNIIMDISTTCNRPMLKPEIQPISHISYSWVCMLHVTWQYTRILGGHCSLAAKRVCPARRALAASCWCRSAQ